MIYGYNKSFPVLWLTSCRAAPGSLQSEVLQHLILRLTDLCNFRSQHDPQLRLGRHAEGSY